MVRCPPAVFTNVLCGGIHSLAGIYPPSICKNAVILSMFNPHVDVFILCIGFQQKNIDGLEEDKKVLIVL